MIKRNSKQLTVAILSIPLFSFTLHANEPTRIWSRIGPEGAHINQVVISPSHSNTLYASTHPNAYYSSDNENILKSLNGGDSWVTLPWQGKALSANTIIANRTHQNYSSYFYPPVWQTRRLAVDLDDPNVVLTPLSGFLLKTVDSGMSWHSIETGSSNYWGLGNENIDATPPQTIEPTVRYPDGESNIQILSTDPENDSIMYGYTTLRHRSALATAPVLLYKSTDKGESWLNITPSGYRYLGRNVVFNPDNRDLIFTIVAKTEADSFVTTVAEDLIMKSEDGGMNWQALNSPRSISTLFDVTQVYLDPVEKNTLYANIKPAGEPFTEMIKTIAKSTNLGRSWDIIDTSPYLPGSIVIDPSNNQKLLMSSKQGVLRSSNGGLNWALSNKGMQHIGGKLSVAVDNSLVMYLASNTQNSVVDSRTATGLYYKSIDGGQHWHTLTLSPVITGYCHEFKINPRDSQDIFCITDANIYQSLNGGEQWAQLKKTASRQLIRAQDGFSIYLSDDKGTSISEDNGESWHLFTPIYEGELSIHPQNQATLYYIIDNQLFSSVDSRETWFKLETPGNIDFNHLLIHPLNPDLMVLYGSYALLLTVDGGSSWRIVLETFNSGNTDIHSFPAEFSFITQLVLHPTDMNSLFLKTNTGIYESSDQGIHWEHRNSGIESYISSSYIDVNLLTSVNDVFVDTSSGVFKFTDKVDFAAVSDCIFNWAERGNADLFPPESVSSVQGNGYTFRYYSQTNTYLGIFHEQEIHQLQPDISNDITPQDSFASYQAQSGCPDITLGVTSHIANN